jgi:hypothetical protein
MASIWYLIFGQYVINWYFYEEKEYLARKCLLAKRAPLANLDLFEASPFDSGCLLLPCTRAAMSWKKPGFDVAVTVRVDGPMAAAIENYRASQPIPPSVTATYRYLLELGLQTAQQDGSKTEAPAP